MLTLDNSPAREGQPEIYELLSEYAATFARQFDDDAAPIKSLYLYSHEPGTGKTTTAAAVLNEYIVRHYIGAIKRGRQPAEVPAYFLDVNAWQSDFNEFNRPRIPDEIAEPAAERYYRAQKRAMTAPFVVLDDIGVRECSEAFRADLHRIINARVTAGLPTVYTSNIPLSEINDVFREVPARLADRMRDLCAVLTFKGGSKRGLQRREGTENER
ncbi:hypothetical protein PACILC2_34570 [Paenibacillus cisolokensis]|uniref:IstB-like ATP-binding domain-containing protein n=2 Tax=Paenibacillus cisolokensis TaxID=1658519 RepID=A0ABQ4N9H9_9BACL|nr:ATP-binding protein [Paenibacillus cisolokensis]GIQ64889.1 hypothetical protein PACILC2_34570 [Paenibacillus cisolokensis]